MLKLHAVKKEKTMCFAIVLMLALISGSAAKVCHQDEVRIFKINFIFSIFSGKIYQVFVVNVIS